MLRGAIGRVSSRVVNSQPHPPLARIIFMGMNDGPVDWGLRLARPSGGFGGVAGDDVVGCQLLTPEELIEVLDGEGKVARQCCAQLHYRVAEGLESLKHRGPEFPDAASLESAVGHCGAPGLGLLHRYCHRTCRRTSSSTRRVERCPFSRHTIPPRSCIQSRGNGPRPVLRERPVPCRSSGRVVATRTRAGSLCRGLPEGYDLATGKPHREHRRRGGLGLDL